MSKKKKTLEELKILYENNNREILGIEYREYGDKGKFQTYIKYKCLAEKCNHVGYMMLCHMKKGSGCPACVGHVVTNYNCLANKRPDLIKYFPNPEDAYSYTVSSNKKVKLKCPNCGCYKAKLFTIKNLSAQGFSCDYCSDKISVPEKFGINLFKQLCIDFETQKIFDWAKDKRYDKYFVLDDEIFICEINGIQHYDSRKSIKHCLQEEQENDKLKYDLAISNGIKLENYIVIDARYSEYEWLRDSFEKSFSNIFDLSNVDWLKVWEDCQSSIVVEVWNAWNNRDENDTTSKLVKDFKISKFAIINYLKRGVNIGVCEYNGIEEMRKSHRKSRKQIAQYSLNDEFINIWSSGKQIEDELKIDSSSVSSCCKGKRKSAGGFKWSYAN